MRRRALAAAAVVGWSKAAVAARIALATVVEQPAAAQVSATAAPAVDCSPTFPINEFSNYQVRVFAKSACSGTLDVLASYDNQQWKSIGSHHANPGPFGYGAAVEANCLPGAWWYKGVFVSDDHSSVSITPSRRATLVHPPNYQNPVCLYTPLPAVAATRFTS